ncbi:MULTISPECIES: flagellar biosynthetic protein FliR [Pseudoalteromonas]|jgi:flagellar biosynthetic protein FliR|uniref:Flagellar biosynthetic protein FliR n=1 Tax=Pseudoalteromonas aliena SW19 TaxID=1314866 RepID=A0ABR9E0U1_9GAMM|nr:MULTISPECIES: flagellar biosynthetic protein FliR [Pseudoalteromonas]MBB1384213.1 flagellar type III secretion system protein FliR [Pseudoalteromonas sp. SG45-5]MBB1392515.1 flagellar type III secretion system protein FliR [Pseudoalteromonas sp. SG44-4]MBB1447582.1 flagellar type III secretion system protein FliR [Pseudoalteromonas sp. SG41-6]MBE0360227.1 flagellar biosynthetic protein FliR [Pseudoalteromonas aliena SW19]TMO03390.1 flagellar biosynthetic protein FliR [Pseudoalteromonas sp. 
MELPFSVIIQWLSDFLLPLVRISSMIMVMAGLGAKNVPTRIKVGLAVVVTLVALPNLPPATFTNLFSFEMILVVIQQLLIGVAIGFASTLLLNTFVLAGQILAMQTGLGFASVVDPSNGMSVPAVGQFYLILATLLFFVFNGHLMMIQMVIHSFEVLPVDGNWWAVDHYWDIVTWGGWMFSTALVLSLAPLTAMLVINMSFGIMTRAAPQLNIFSIGFPLTLVAGLIIIWATLGNFIFQFEYQWLKMIELMCTLVGCSP